MTKFWSIFVMQLRKNTFFCLACGVLLDNGASSPCISPIHHKQFKWFKTPHHILNSGEELPPSHSTQTRSYVLVMNLYTHTLGMACIPKRRYMKPPYLAAKSRKAWCSSFLLPPIVGKFPKMGHDQGPGGFLGARYWVTHHHSVISSRSSHYYNEGK